MDKKTLIVLIITAIVTMLLVGTEVYFWKGNNKSALEYSGFNTKKAGIDFCNNEIPDDQKADCLAGIEARFK